MNKDIKNIIIANLPEKVTSLSEYCPVCDNESCSASNAFNQALSQIPVSLIADEVLKVVVETCCKDCRKMIELSNEKTQ